MNPRKVGAPGTETDFDDDFGSEERVLEDIVIPEDQLTRPSEMFPPESRQTRTTQRNAVLDFEKPIVQSPGRPPTRPMAGPPPATRSRRPGSVGRSIATIIMVGLSIVLAVLAGAAVRNRLNTSLLSQYAETTRTRISALRELLPRGEVPQRADAVRDPAVGASTTAGTDRTAGVAASTTGTTDSTPATVAETNNVAIDKARDVTAAAPPSQQKKISQRATRASLPSSRPGASSSTRRAAASPPAPPARPTIQRTQEPRPAPPVINAPASSPPVSAVTSTSPVPVNPAPAPLSPAVAPSVPSPAPPPAALSAPGVTAPSATPAGALPVETRAVALTLNRYQDAFSALDVNAAHAVWPSVDVKALAKAFDQLEEQTFDLEGCDITVTGARAQADCA